MIKKNCPLRMCIVCRKMLQKNELVRVVKNTSGEIFVDETLKASGRGAWICKKNECTAKLTKNKSLNRAFSGEVHQEVYSKAIEVANNGTRKTN